MKEDEKALLKNIGRALAFERYLKEESQDEVGLKLGFCKGSMQAYERATTRMTIFKLMKLCHYYNKPIEFFIGEFNVSNKKDKS